MSYTGKDRRRYTRFPVEIAVYFSLIGNSRKVCKAEIKNVGEGGMLLATERQIEKEEMVLIDISLPPEQFRVLMMAKVLESVRTTGRLTFATRVEFPVVDRNQKEKIKNMLDIFFNLTSK